MSDATTPTDDVEQAVLQEPHLVGGVDPRAADLDELPAAPSSEAVLQLRDFRVTFPTLFGEVQAVRGVDLDVGAGEMLGIVGESGSGKSVTFLGLMGLLPKSARITGSATVAGTELVGAAPKLINRVRGKRVAMIFQDPLSALNPVHRTGDQIVEMIQSHQKLGKKQAWERSVELLDLVGIPQPRDRASQYPHEFSGGMRQRVMIAMAIANDPEVLIADEPTTALDVTVQAQILEVLQRVQHEMHTAIVLITHDLGVVARVADRVQVMYAGRPVERGDVRPIFDHPSHPYTRGLLSSLPALGTERLSPIPGSPPNMLHPPSGCAFRPRCPHAIAACGEGMPPELVPFRDLATACIRAEELAVAEVAT
jgi:oligopeptide/dipeptide ABC transporter ATP-binding protein